MSYFKKLATLKTSNSKNQSLYYVFVLTSALVIPIGVKLSALTLKSFLMDALNVFVKGGLPPVCFVTVLIGTAIQVGRLIFLGHGLLVNFIIVTFHFEVLCLCPNVVMLHRAGH